eukprot:CCRYP_012141-RA/>CCRYP_012141-RA protein AED:0.50 eAED:0.31 QI:0/0/0/0.5/1/1/2/0/267
MVQNQDRAILAVDYIKWLTFYGSGLLRQGCVLLSAKSVLCLHLMLSVERAIGEDGAIRCYVLVFHVAYFVISECMSSGSGSGSAVKVRSLSRRSYCCPMITLENVHTYSTYELRQELKRRGRFCNDDYVGPINHRVLLKEMVAILVREGEKEQEDTGKASSAARIADEAAKARAERKSAAIERSKHRQAHKEYFSSKKEANADLQKQKDASLVNSCDIDGSEDKSANCNGERNHYGEKEEDIVRSDDPFRSQFPTKISGRCFLRSLE